MTRATRDDYRRMQRGLSLRHGSCEGGCWNAEDCRPTRCIWANAVAAPGMEQLLGWIIVISLKEYIRDAPSPSLFNQTSRTICRRFVTWVPTVRMPRRHFRDLRSKRLRKTRLEIIGKLTTGTKVWMRAEFNTLWMTIEIQVVNIPIPSELLIFEGHCGEDVGQKVADHYLQQPRQLSRVTHLGCRARRPQRATKSA